MEKLKLNNNRIISITQILILVIGILAFSYAVGSIDVISAQVDGEEPPLCQNGEKKCVGLASEEVCTNGVWKASLCPSGQICENDAVGCAPDTSTQPPFPGSPETPTETSTPDITYEVGQIVTAKDENGKTQKYKLTGEDVEDGKIREDSSDGLTNWAANTGIGIGTGVLTDAAGKAIAGETLGQFWGGASSSVAGTEGAASFGAYAQAVAGPVIGAFLGWAIYKYIAKGDVRNMRDITNIALVTGGLGITVSVILVAAGVTGPVGWIAGAIVLVVVMVVGLFTFKNYSQEMFTYVITAWKAPVGGDFCEKCNDLRYGCGEYQCRSFGKACEIENKGSTQEICVWKNPKDILPPIITALEKVLSSEDYSYQPLDVVQGVKIDYSKDPDGRGCVPAYTAVTLGIETDEFAECKIDTERTPDFENMAVRMAKIEGFVKEHILSLPHVATPSVENQLAAGIPESEITNGQAQEFYIRCEDVNGNSNPEEFIMEFCVQDGPDTSAPIILGTNFLAASFLQFNQTDAPLEIYTNEPAECKWSPEDLSYDQMQFNMSTCSLGEGDYLFSNFGYGCQGALTGLKDRVENTVYIKCKDKPWWTSSDQGQRYANQDSFILTLQGTEPLVIDEITVNGKPSGATIKDSVNTITAKLEVKTSAGAQQGKSKCEYESGGNFVGFYNEGNREFINVNTQNLFLPEGDYNISIRCLDAGGNIDNGNIEFTLDTDREAPIAVRAYYDVNNLRIITDEPATCVYNTNANIACSYEFDDGEEMGKIGELKHHVAWEANKKYYIRCKDAFENRPLPGQCSIIVRAFETSQ